MIETSMQNVNTFFGTLIKSLLPQPPFYHHLTRTPIRSSIRYFLKLIFLISILALVNFSLFINPGSISRTLLALKNGLSNFPRSLVVEIKNGTTTSSLNQPYFLWLKLNAKIYLLGVVDPKGTTAKIDEYRSLFLVTAKDLAYRKSVNEKPRIIPLSYFQSMAITAQTIDNVRLRIDKILPLVPLLYIFIILLLGIFLYIGSLFTSIIYIGVASVVTYVIFIFFFRGKLGHHVSPIHGRKVFQLSLHAATFPLVVDYIVPIWPPLFLLLLFIFVFSGAYEAFLDRNFV